MAIVICCLVILMMVPYIRTETGSNKALHHTTAAVLLVISVHLVTGFVADWTEFFCRMWPLHKQDSKGKAIP